MDYERNGSGATLGSYVLGGTQLISQTRGSTASYFLQDGQGSTRTLTNSSGAVTDTYSYNAFGDLSSSAGTTVNPYRYTGQQFDTATRLYDLRARYYAPLLGHFLSQDTQPFDLSNPLEVNRYVYAANDPIDLVDPRGQQAFMKTLSRYGSIGAFASNEGNTAIFIAGRIGILAVTTLILVLQNPFYIDWLGASLSKKAGGAKEAAQHLAMLLGRPVAGYNPHPGRPDPEGRDRIHNIIGLLAILKALAENVGKSGKGPVGYLLSQGWNLIQIDNFVNELRNFVKFVLPYEPGVTPEVLAQFRAILNQLGVY